MKNLQAINTEMILKIQEQAEKLAFYENLHSPSIYKEHSNTPKKDKPCKKDFLSSKEGTLFLSSLMNVMITSEDKSISFFCKFNREFC